MLIDLTDFRDRRREREREREKERNIDWLPSICVLTTD